MKIEASNVIENEMQKRREEYFMQKKRDAMNKYHKQTGLEYIGKMKGISTYKPVKSMFAPPKENKDINSMSE